MITRLTVRNFKSVKSLEMDCRRVNVLIGEPNTGKSNILEALGFLSWCGAGSGVLSDYVRLRSIPNLFYDEAMDDPVCLRTEGASPIEITIRFEAPTFMVRSNKSTGTLSALHVSETSRPSAALPDAQRIRFFKFQELDQFMDADAGSLKPPNGQNLFSVVYGSKALRAAMQEFFKPYGLTLVMKPQERRFEVQKQSDGVVVSYPYTLTADSLQRVIFYMVAMASNKDATLVFEEPEAHAFPYYTKYLGERIALDQSNQYFIATHNPYLLRAIVEKAKRQDVNVGVTYLRDYATQVACLAQDQLDQLLDADPFFNLSAFIEQGTPA